MSLKTTCLVHNKGSMAIIIFMVNKFKWLMKYDWGFGICPFGLVLLSNCILLSVQCSYCIYYISIYAVKYYIFGLGIKGYFWLLKLLNSFMIEKERKYIDQIYCPFCLFLLHSFFSSSHGPSFVFSSSSFSPRFIYGMDNTHPGIAGGNNAIWKAYTQAA